MARKHSLESLLKVLRQKLPVLAERYDVETLEVFGSYVRAEQKADSDLDVLDLYRHRELLVRRVGGQGRSGDERFAQARDWESHLERSHAGMKRVHDDYLRDMLENAEKALSFVEGMD